MAFLGWSEEELRTLLVSEGYTIPLGTTVDELRAYAAEIHLGTTTAAADDDDDEVIVDAMDSNHLKPIVIVPLVVRPSQALLSEGGEDRSSFRNNRPGSNRSTSNTGGNSSNRHLSGGGTGSVRQLSFSDRQHHHSLSKQRSQKQAFVVEVEEKEDEKPFDESHGTAAVQQPETAAVVENDFQKWGAFIEDEEEQLRHAFEDEARYDEEADGGEWEDSDPFAKPSKEAATKYASMHHLRRRDNATRFSVCGTRMGRFCFRTGPLSGGFDWLGEHTVSEIASYGPGLSLHFKSIKLLFWLFLLATCISSPQVVLNLQVVNNNNFLFRTTLGNLNQVLNVTSSPPTTLLFLCGTSQAYVCDYTLDELSGVYTVTNLLVVSLFTLAILWTQYFIPQESHILSSLFLSLDRYSLFIPVVPKACGEGSLGNYFEALTQGEEVEEVNIAYDEGRLISLFMERGEVVKELWRVTGRVLLEFSTLPDRPTRFYSVEEMTLFKVDKLERLVDYYDLLLSTYHSLNEETRGFNKGGNNALCAIVTFSTRSGLMKAREALQSPSAPLFQNLKLQAQPAMPPSTIQWENLEYSKLDQYGRQCLSIVIVLFAIAGSFASALGSQAYRNELLLADSSLYCSGNTTLLCSMCSTYTFAQSTSSLFAPSDECHSFWSERAPMFAFALFATGVVALVNFMVGRIAIGLSPLEKHHSLHSLTVSVTLRLFVAYALNTAFVFVIIYALFRINPNNTNDDDASWFSEVGVMILITMLLNIVAPHVQIVLAVFYQRVFLPWFTDKPLLQREANERMIGPSFPMAMRSAQLMMQTFISLVFGPALPLLYPIACVSFLFFYYADKFGVLSFYRTPPEFDSALTEWLAVVMWCGLVGNLCLAVYFYSGLWFQALTLEERLTLPAILPMVVILGVLLTLFVVSKAITHCCACRKTTPNEEEEVLPPLSLAKKSGWLRGLKSYNILQNPKYRRAFGVNKSFCDQHKLVRDVISLEDGNELPQLPDAVREWLNQF